MFSSWCSRCVPASSSFVYSTHRPLALRSCACVQAPTFLAFASSLRSRGAQFSNLGGIGGLRGGDVAGPTGKHILQITRYSHPLIHYGHTLMHLTVALVWSMPGGFTSGGRDGYQTVDEPTPETVRPPPGPPPPSSNHHQQSQAAPGAYQSV